MVKKNLKKVYNASFKKWEGEGTTNIFLNSLEEKVTRKNTRQKIKEH